jgi:hypothetical protein
LEKRVLKMTEMQYILCEAETNGLIDLDTRNIMLEAYDIMIESTALQRNEQKIIDDMNKLENKIKKNDGAYRRLLQSASSEAEKNRIKEKWEKIIKELESEYNKLDERYKKYKIDDRGGTVSLSKQIGKNTGRLKAHIISDSDEEHNERIRAGMYAKDGTKEKFYSRGKDPRDKKPNRYLNAQKTLRESADDLRISIYESELNGEITVEEREELIEALNEKLNTEE